MTPGRRQSQDPARDAPAAEAASPPDSPLSGAEPTSSNAASPPDSPPSADAAPRGAAPTPVVVVDAGAKPEADPRPASNPILLAILVAVVLSGALLILGVAQGQIRALPAALVLILGTLTLFAGQQAVVALARGETIEISSHWGGLGGGLGGWRVSPVATLLLLALILLGATLASSAIDRGAGNGSADNPSIANQTNANREAPDGNAAGANEAGANESGASQAGANAADANAADANAADGNAADANIAQGGG